MEIGKKQQGTEVGEILRNIQDQYGGKAEKQRQIKKSLDKDDFMRIMITQMKNQDPTNPMKAEQFAAELAQFTSVEQLQNLNKSFDQFGRSQKPQENMAMANLIGKQVTMKKDRFMHQENESSPIRFNLPVASTEGSLQIMDDKGEVIFKKELGQRKPGPVEVLWDGSMVNGGTVKTGSFQYKVVAKDEKGGEIKMDSQGKAPVVGVSFEGPDPVLLVGDPAKPEKVPMQQVVRIETS